MYALADSESTLEAMVSGEWEDKGVFFVANVFPEDPDGHVHQHIMGIALGAKFLFSQWCYREQHPHRASDRCLCIGSGATHARLLIDRGHLTQAIALVIRHLNEVNLEDCYNPYDEFSPCSNCGLYTSTPHKCNGCGDYFCDNCMEGDYCLTCIEYVCPECGIYDPNTCILCGQTHCTCGYSECVCSARFPDYEMMVEVLKDHGIEIH